MYARYVPPPKGTAQPPKEPVATPPQLSQPSQPSAIRPTTYARYVPPPKPSTQPTSSQHIVFNGDEADHTDEPPAKKAKITREDEPKKHKKAKKNKKESNIEVDSGVTNGDQLNGEGHPEKIAPYSQNGEANGESTSTLVQVHDPMKEKKAKKSKKVKTKVLPSDSEVADDDEFEIEPQASPLHNGIKDEESTQAQPTTGAREAVPESKKEKKAKKKKLKAANEEVEAEKDDISIRHKSVLEKAAKSMQKPHALPADTAEQQDIAMQDAAGLNGKAEEVTELHGLEPLPQPEPVAIDTTKPTYETLPSWLAEPIRVSPQAAAAFTDFGLGPELGISAEVAEKLSQKGYKQAFAIQTAVMPQLLPHYCKTMQGDILVSAATGSGKTLAYALPVIRDLSQGNRHITRLRALVVLPTRELVRQAQQVFEECAGAFALDGAKRRVRIATSMGSQTLQKEQTILIEHEQRYDPAAYAQRLKKLQTADEDEEEELAYNTEDEEKADIRRREDRIPTLPDHVISYKSKVDILICTPGRLVEHIKYTPGFSLGYVRWLVVDEADKLLSQNFQQWLDIVIPRLQTEKVPGARNHKQSNLSGVRKVILSATMTRDLDRLGGLKLRRPKLVVLEGSGRRDDLDADHSKEEHALPEFLEEAALKVSDPNLKPLFLLDLLQSPLVLGNHISTPGKPSQSDDEASSSGSSTSSSGSDTDSDSESESDSDTSSDLDSSAAHKRPSSLLPSENSINTTPSVLIFTRSNETAVRLSRLLALLSPALGALVGTLTSTTPYARRKTTLRSFAAAKLRVLVASDLVARGVDLPRLDHVVNYDMPASVASYVHRVGRTARAGRSGRAWTLVADAEARWFWREVAGEKKGKGKGKGKGEGYEERGVVRRAQKVQRIRVTEEKADREVFEEKVKRYEDSLERLGREAEEARKGRGK